MADYFAPSPQNLKGESEFEVNSNQELSGQTLSGQSSMEVGFSMPTLVGQGTFTTQGLRVVEHPGGYHHVAKYVGERNVPHDIARDRRYVYELLRRMGTPILYKKMLNQEDTFDGTVTESANFDPIYGQTRNRDPLSHGIGFVSTELSEEEWIDPTTSQILTGLKNPSYMKAPKYRGFGPGMLIYIIEPDTAVDFFKHTPEGVFMKVQTATAIAPWWPDINDNDLLIHVELDRSGYIVGTQERYQAKMANPISIRGAKERRGRQEYTGDFGSRYVINTTFEMVLLPRNHEYMNVEVDR